MNPIWVRSGETEKRDSPELATPLFFMPTPEPINRLIDFY